MPLFFSRQDLSRQDLSYRTSLTDLYRQVGIYYTGCILKAKGLLIPIPELLESEFRLETGYRSSLTAASPRLPFTAGPWH
jgi:hypothetical protein